jgi:hypothetical protein
MGYSPGSVHVPVYQVRFRHLTTHFGAFQYDFSGPYLLNTVETAPKSAQFGKARTSAPIPPSHWRS